ncbi:MAG TPA: hypothetical protein VJL31_12950 [Gemmatimonadales bacterium]|nr:hypothetical protein [Gemmatimonadales bacterium]
MADVAQWTADQFWRQIQWVASQGRTQKARLDQQKLQLQNAYSSAKAKGDTETMTALQPLIHKNSEARIYWAEMRGKFNRIVEEARAFLASHGIQEPPTLAGLGVLPAVIVPALWVAGLVAVVAIVHQIDAVIKDVNAGLAKLGPIGGTALALVPLALVVLAAMFLWPRLRKAAA